mmetsp:Transcript_16151/g.28627  ORF Transcript_16151/g.28627 Transcript_16151/m.28627 type:complete len:357 (-) Transcript_16151:222-1292(-)
MANEVGPLGGINYIDNVGGFDDSQQQFHLVENKFRKLCEDLHISFLDVKVYEKYVLSQRTPERLYKLCIVTKLLMEHKAHTMDVLRLVQHREVVVICIFALINDFAKGDIGTIELQDHVTRLMHSLQRLSLKVVEAVDSWREPLTRPFPFMFQRVNYLLKIITDNHVLSSSPLSGVLPLNLYEYPLCSQLPTIGHFTKALRGKSGVIQAPKTNGPPPANKRWQMRLQYAEARLKQELSHQQSLVKEMQSLSSEGLFLPILNTDVIPGCATGISLRSSTFQRRLQQALQQAVAALSVPATQMPMFPDSVSHDRMYGYANKLLEAEEEGAQEGDYEDEDGGDMDPDVDSAQSSLVGGT